MSIARGPDWPTTVFTKRRLDRGPCPNVSSPGGGLHGHRGRDLARLHPQVTAFSPALDLNSP